MIFIIILALIVLGVMAIAGVFTKPAPCAHCGNEVKGTKQMTLTGDGATTMICSDCYNKVNSLFYDARNSWSYADYVDYRNWVDSFAAQKAVFKPNFEFGDVNKLRIDTDNLIFGINNAFGRPEDELVIPFSEITGYQREFNEIGVSEGTLTYEVNIIITTKIKNGILKINLGFDSLTVQEKGIFKKSYDYSMPTKFDNAFTIFEASLGRANESQTA